MPSVVQSRSFALEPNSDSFVTYQSFLNSWAEGEHVEWVDGRIIEMPPVTDVHMQLSRFLITLLTHYVEHHGLGEVGFDPFQMKTGPELPGRAPDLFFVAKSRLNRLKKLFMDGPADLVIEIVSPGSRAVDRGEKYFEYEEGGVKEYWLLDPLRKQAEFYRLDRRRTFELIKPEAGIYRSAVIDGLWIKVDWLWKRPKLISVLKQWDLV